MFGIITLIISLPWDVIGFTYVMIGFGVNGRVPIIGSLIILIAYLGFLTMSICSVGILFFRQWARKGLIISMIMAMLVWYFITGVSHGKEFLTAFFPNIYFPFFYFSIAICYFSLPKVRELFKKSAIDKKNGDNEKSAEGK